MSKINAVITGVGGYVPEDILSNEDISKMVDTTDEWIMARVGIKERRILKGEGLGTSYMGIRAVKQLLEKTNTNPEEIEVILVASTTPDHHFPTTASVYIYGNTSLFKHHLKSGCVVTMLMGNKYSIQLLSLHSQLTEPFCCPLATDSHIHQYMRGIGTHVDAVSTTSTGYTA